MKVHDRIIIDKNGAIVHDFEIYGFEDAPIEWQELSMHGGDEDYILVFSTSYYSYRTGKKVSDFVSVPLFQYLNLEYGMIDSNVSIHLLDDDTFIVITAHA